MFKTIISAMTAALAINLAAGEIEIISAKYGSGDSWIDLTEKAKTCVISNVAAVIPADNGFAGGDPAKGKAKKLVVEYKLDGEVKTAETPERQSLLISNVKADPDPALKVLHAFYGAKDKWLDVSAFVNEAIANNKELTASNAVFKKDPIPGIGKKLVILFSRDGKVHTINIPENNKLSMAAFEKK